MRACGVHTYEAYQALLGETPDEYERLKDTLTINVTRFYRNRETWESLADTVLPALCSRLARDMFAYGVLAAPQGRSRHTLAMLFADQSERLGRRHWLDRVHISMQQTSTETAWRGPKRDGTPPRRSTRPRSVTVTSIVSRLGKTDMR